MRVFLLCVLVAAATAIGMVAGCNDLGVGRKCLPTSSSGQMGMGGSTGNTQISSPSLECVSRLCYQQQGSQGSSTQNRNYCTARCASDDDCKGALISGQSGLCNSYFVCAIPTDVGDFACQQFCVCHDDLVGGVNEDPVDGGVICPSGCQAKHMCPSGGK